MLITSLSEFVFFLDEAESSVLILPPEKEKGHDVNACRIQSWPPTHTPYIGIILILDKKSQDYFEKRQLFFEQADMPVAIWGRGHAAPRE